MKEVPTRTENEFELAQCAGKEKYETPALAHAVARRRNRRSRDTRVNPYRCQYCGHYHMGTGRRRRNPPSKKD